MNNQDSITVARTAEDVRLLIMERLMPTRLSPQQIRSAADATAGFFEAQVKETEQ